MLQIDNSNNSSLLQKRYFKLLLDSNTLSSSITLMRIRLIFFVSLALIYSATIYGSDYTDSDCADCHSEATTTHPCDCVCHAYQPSLFNEINRLISHQFETYTLVDFTQLPPIGPVTEIEHPPQIA